MTVFVEQCPENPAVVYRESLSRGSYWAVQNSLATAVEILTGERTDPWTFPWQALRYQHVARVRTALIQKYSPATVNRILSALRQVLKYAWRLGYVDHETYTRAADTENVKVPSQRLGRAVEAKELEALFAVCAADPSAAGCRDAAILAVLYGGGLRRGELCGLDLADFDTEADSLAVQKGKGSRGRTIYLSPEACRYVRTWSEARGTEPGPMFCPVSSAGTMRLTRLCGESVFYILRRRQREAGLDGVTPHGLRRSFVTKLLEAGVDLFTVQKLAGHANAATTARYDLRDERTGREAMKSLPIFSVAQPVDTTSSRTLEKRSRVRSSCRRLAAHAGDRPVMPEICMSGRRILAKQTAP